MSQVPPAGGPHSAGPAARPLAAVQLLEGVVVAQGRSGAILEIAGRRLGLEGAPPLSSKTRVTLELAHGLRAVNQTARLVAIDGRMLETSLPVRLHPMAGSGARPVAEPVPAGPGAQPGGRRPTPEPFGSPGHASPALDPASAARLLQAIQLARSEPATSRKPRPGEARHDRATSISAALPGEMAEPPRQSQAGGWRLLLLPFGAEVADWLKLYLGEDDLEGDRQASEAAAAAARRAIFELDLSHLGRCQLDALCHGQRFDLIVRSERAFDAPLESEIRAAHQEALDAAGWSGAIAFRSPDLLIMPGPARPLETPMTA
jgi:hypothetical protein